MIVKYLETLREKRIVLASQSPRREQLLHLVGLKARKYPSRFEETLQPKEFPSPSAYAVETARRKALDVSETIEEVYDLIIAADTIVVIDGEVLEKPSDEEDAIGTLLRLSGRQHRVFTGVVLLLPTPSPDRIHSFSVGSDVWFDTFDREEAEAYVKTKEPMDKAGSYGIQGVGSTLVKKIDGCYFNVMGLPINALASRLKTLIEQNKL